MTYWTLWEWVHPPGRDYFFDPAPDFPRLFQLAYHQARSDWRVSLPWIGTICLRSAWIALAANAINLLDLRPLRAVKGAALLAVLIGAVALGAGDGEVEGNVLVAAVLVAGAFVPYLLLEARRQVMLGDAGANALGAAVAVIGVWALPLGAIGALTALLALFHLWTERHSVSEAIAARPWLARLDAWGWRQE
jgi:UDP-N-acetylmuramyl pentapeptide phosphotransferase/UDP-N-acetylglucosamine-1-phosphate transferase